MRQKCMEISQDSCMQIYTRVPSEYVYHIISYLGNCSLGKNANLQHFPLNGNEALASLAALD